MLFPIRVMVGFMVGEKEQIPPFIAFRVGMTNLVGGTMA